MEDGESQSKKKKYEANFQQSWLENEKYRKWVIKVDEKNAKCIFCNVKFTVKWDGEKALSTHLNSGTHKKKVRNIDSNSLMTTFLPKKNYSEELNVATIEIASIYHAISHHHSYLSTDCGIKLNASLYSDSPLSQKVHCGRTKAEAIVLNVLAPHSIESTIQDLKRSQSGNGVHFSIAIDVSNKGSQKMYPLVIRYFDQEKGVQDKLMDFYEDPNETSQKIFENIENFMLQHDLDTNFLSAFSADNASVNYGAHNSVYQKIKEKYSDTKVVKANCNCHVLHNAARNAMKALTYDVENLIMKIYAEFSNSAKRTSELKTLFEEFEIEYRKVLRHGPTRWLSLGRAVDRLILSWPAVSAYFKSRGEAACHKIIWEFVKECGEGNSNDARSLSTKITLQECYLYFINHYMNMLTEAILLLERNTVTAAELHTIMRNVKDKIESRLHDEFYGAKIMRNMKFLKPSEQDQLKKEANEVYRRTLEYIHKYYDFEDSVFKIFSKFDLTSAVGYEDTAEAVESLGLKNVDEDKLYDETRKLNQVFPQFVQSCDFTLPIDLRWVQLFKITSTFTELPKIIGKIFSIPISNAFVERVFSLMENLWTDERNCLSVNMVKAELIVKINYNMNCQEFLKFLKKPEQEKILKQSLQNKKYSFKCQAGPSQPSAS